MGVEITKEMLNKYLHTVLNGAHGKAVAECGMISAKWVDVKEDRVCHNCKSKIRKGTTALTSSGYKNKYKDKERIHRCYMCGVAAINCLAQVDSEIKEAIFWQQVENDALGGSDGLGQD